MNRIASYSMLALVVAVAGTAGVIEGRARLRAELATSRIESELTDLRARLSKIEELQKSSARDAESRDKKMGLSIEAAREETVQVNKLVLTAGNLFSSGISELRDRVADLERAGRRAAHRELTDREFGIPSPASTNTLSDEQVGFPAKP